MASLQEQLRNTAMGLNEENTDSNTPPKFILNKEDLDSLNNKKEAVEENNTGIETEVKQEEKIEEAPVEKQEVKKEEVKETPKQNTPFISDAFNSFSKNLSQQIENTKTKAKQSADDLLKNIKIDLNNINIVDSSEASLVLLNNKRILDEKKTMQVVACQSSYTLQVSALKNQEIQNINDTDSDVYNSNKKLYRIIYNHIEDTSVGKMSYDTWLRNTSYFDLETILYGIYCMTFPYENKYTIRCPDPDCNHRFEVVTNNNTLIETRGKDEIYEKINEVIAGVTNAKDILNHSHIHTTHRIICNESKIIFDSRIPSLYDYLEGCLAKLTPAMINDYSDATSASLFIDKIYIPDLGTLNNTGELKFVPVSNRQEIIRTIAELPYYDGVQLLDDIGEFIDKYRVTYSLKNITCPSCGRVIENIPLSIENLLFLAIRKGRVDN